jgi:hypothetical protein
MVEKEGAIDVSPMMRLPMLVDNPKSGAKLVA